jgi:hypothetical protein
VEVVLAVIILLLNLALAEAEAVLLSDHLHITQGPAQDF